MTHKAKVVGEGLNLKRSLMCNTAGRTSAIKGAGKRIAISYFAWL